MRWVAVTLSSHFHSKRIADLSCSTFGAYLFRQIPDISFPPTLVFFLRQASTPTLYLLEEALKKIPTLVKGRRKIAHRLFSIPEGAKSPIIIDTTSDLLNDQASAQYSDLS